MSIQAPRSQTGLVPTSHKKTMSIMHCPSNWKKLPPRPPPELHPFKGDHVLIRRKLKKGSRKSAGILQYENTHNIIQEVSSRDVTPSIGVKKGKPSWNPFQQSLIYHQYKQSERMGRVKSKMDSLSFIRTSAARRNLMSNFEKQLESELSFENSAAEPPNEEFIEASNSKADVLDEIIELKELMRTWALNDDVSTNLGKNTYEKIPNQYLSHDLHHHDYKENQSIPSDKRWRKALSTFQDLNALNNSGGSTIDLRQCYTTYPFKTVNRKIEPFKGDHKTIDYDQTCYTSRTHDFEKRIGSAPFHSDKRKHSEDDAALEGSLRETPDSVEKIRLRSDDEYGQYMVSLASTIADGILASLSNG